MRITHVVCTAGFAGVERHVATLAAAQHDRGHEVTVLGGDASQMRAALGPRAITVLPVTGLREAVGLLAGPEGRQADVVATHMMTADTAAAAALITAGTPIVSTRHFAARRGSSIGGRVAAPFVARRITAEVAVSRHIAEVTGGRATVIHPGVTHAPGADQVEREQTVLLVQRLEVEKATDVGLRAFASSGLADRGWRLLIAGDGSQRRALEQLAADLGITGRTRFLGTRSDIPELVERAGIFLAPCPVEGQGLSVLEAMAGGAPVVASAAGGHLESFGAVVGAALFPAGDTRTAGRLLADLAADPHRRDAYGSALRRRQRTTYSVEAQAAATDEVYRHALAAIRRRPQDPPRGRGLVVVSLEPWDRVWRRNQHLVAGLLRDDPNLRVLFVEPASDLVHTVRLGRVPRPGRGLRRGPYLPGVAPDALWLYQPTKPLPRRLNPMQDDHWATSIRRVAERLGIARAVLWVNDPHGAKVLETTGWPSLYDITDDWLQADRDQATHDRLVQLEETLMRRATEVVVCSTGLERTKSPIRTVTLLRNAVDDSTTTPVPRPPDLPSGPVVVYVGTLHSDRLDVLLCLDTAEALRDVGTLVLVGPNSLTPAEDAALAAVGVARLGSKDRRDVPGYLQHADVLVVPHVVDDFTESLDPIKLYEYRAVGRRVVSTPVSGFREMAGPRVDVVDRSEFPAMVRSAVPAPDRFPIGADDTVPTWADRVREMRLVLDRVDVPGPESVLDHPGSAVPVSVRTRLAHAAVQVLAEQHDIDLLHIKGHALDESLVHPGRRAHDVDVLVRPSQVRTFLAACTDAGFVPTGRFATSSPFEHSVTLYHPTWGYLDVHRLFPGIGLAPDRAFERMWDTRTSRLVAGRSCPTPEVTVQVVLLVLHAARNLTGGQASADVEHCWRAADEERRREVRHLVSELHAETAFAAGIGDLGSLPPSRERDLWLSVTRTGRLQEWRARIAAAPDVATRARLLARVVLVNTDHLATELGRHPTALEVGLEFLARGRRAAQELAGRGR